MEILENFNWVDVLLVLLLIRSIYTGARIGLTAETFNLIGTVSSLVIGFHYYQGLAAVLLQYINILSWSSELISLTAIILLIRLIFKFATILLLKVLSVQFVSQIERVGGALVSLARGFLIGGLFLIALSLLPFQYLNSSILEKSSLSCYFINSSVSTYNFLISIVPSQKPKEIIKAPKAKQPNQQKQRQTKSSS